MPLCASARSRKATGVTRRILVIDDDAGVRATVIAILEDHGYEVVTADNGQRGIDAFRRIRPDLLITDIVMPVKEGLQTIKEVRREHPEAKIIAMSAGSRVGRNDFLEIARTLGARDVIVKPFDPDDLVARVVDCFAAD
jgi:DNA-binding response OmpR family regulator